MTSTISTTVLTGSTGFIGSAVLEELLTRGRRVVVLTRPDSDCRRLSGLKGFEQLTYVRLDDPGLSERLKEAGAFVFIHCAWRGVAGKDRGADYQITENVPLTIESVRLAVRCGCRQWIGLGSQAEYGNPNRVISEASPVAPTTLYGRAKLAAGIASLALCDAAGLNGAWLRVFSTYGPGDAGHWMIPQVARQFLRGEAPQVTLCEQQWDYLHIRDAARAIVAAADSRVEGIFNVGSGRTVSLRDVVELIRAETGATVQAAYGAVAYSPGQVMHLQADITRLQQATGWSPQISLSEGIRETVAWLKKTKEPAQASGPARSV